MTANHQPLRDRIAGNRQVFWEGDLRKSAKPQSRKQRRKTDVTENEVAKIVVEATYCIHKNNLDPGCTRRPMKFACSTN